MSATMELLKGNDKAKAKGKTKPQAEPEAPAADETDAELQAEEPAEEQDDAAADAAEADTEKASEYAMQEQEEPAAVAIPTSKTEVHALKMAELPGVHEAMGSPIADFDKMDLKGKKQALLNHLFPKGGKAKSVIDNSDQLTQVSKEIETLKTRKEIEAELSKLMEAEGETAFRKGGLLVKLSEIGDFGEHDSLRSYILAYGIAKDYRTARYWMELYTGLLEIGIPYADVEEIGWTKILILLKVLTKENVEDWKKKALAMNVATLKATVDAEEAGSAKPAGSSTQGPSEIKSMVFKFHKDQTETANDALAKAKKIIGTESKEVAADHIFVEYLGTASNKPKKGKDKDEAPAPVAAGYDPENVDVRAFFDAVKARYPDTKEAMAFLFQDANDDEQPEEVTKGEKDPVAYFEVLWPEVVIDINVP